jgi:holo-[acyl-carrier protein] synthase
LIPPREGAYVVSGRKAAFSNASVSIPEAPPPKAIAMILGIGTDLLDVSRMEQELLKGKVGPREELFTPSEIAYCEGMRNPARHFAARFAAKEALVKALPVPGAIPRLRDVEVERTETGAPRLILHGDLRNAAWRLGVKRILVSLSHTDGLAAATVVLEG